MRAAERPEFMPPSEGGLARSFGMALLAHAVLVLALSWGVKWKRDEPTVTAEAELWANTPQQAAPKPVEAPPPAPPPPAPAPPPPQPTQAQRDADIALQKEREEREEREKARRAEAERQKQLAEKRRREEQEEARKEEARKEEARKEEARKEDARKEQARRAEEKKKEEQAKLRKQQQEEQDKKRLAELREENLRRIQGLAGATGPRESTGTAMRSSGPSASYAGRLAAHFQRHVVYPGGVDTIVGNPQAVVQVRVSPTGEIMSARLSKSSGNPSWDEAAVRAIERSERIPPDTDGRYVNEFMVEMRPKR